GSAVVMASHPSLTGISSDTGMSGSTAWHNSVRARGYFKAAIDTEDDSLRLLEWRKNNYGPKAENILLRWKNGVYAPEPHAGSLDQIAADAKMDKLFMDLLMRFAMQGRHVSDKKGTTFAPALFADEQEAKEVKATNKALADAMRRLFKDGKITVVIEGPKSKP